jgi:hypothetical protein
MRTILTVVGKGIKVGYLKYDPDIEWEKCGKI